MKNAEKRHELSLNFSLPQSERINFINSYLAKRDPTTLTPKNLETISDYLLWRDSIANSVNTKSPVESLDALTESPAFNENSLIPITDVPFKKPRIVFDRAAALDAVSPVSPANRTIDPCENAAKSALMALFREIDELDLQINFYDLAHNKRKKPPRAELLKRFSEDQQQTLKEETTHWTGYQYLKKRRLLIELRREQFTLKDFFCDKVLKHYGATPGQPIERLPFTDIMVLPLGLKPGAAAPPWKLFLFLEEEKLNPCSFQEDDLRRISRFYWGIKEFSPSKNQFCFDFRKEEDVYQFLLRLEELNERIDRAAALNEEQLFIRDLIGTFEFYRGLARLKDIHQDILDMKVRKEKNADIAAAVNVKYGKHYGANYISTIFKQKIVKEICAAAAYHEQIVESIFFEEEFKTCCNCGRTLLRLPRNFMRKGRSKDGLNGRCKICG